MNENQTTKGQIFEKLNANAVGVATHSDPHSRGITLVALIITIIVMLILVAVSITIAIKGNLFGTAKSGVKGMTIEAYKENLEAIRVNAMMEQIKNNLTTVEFMDKVEEGITASKVFEERQDLKKTSKSVKVTTKEGYLFKITENKVTYMGLASEQGELTINLSKENTDFIYNPEGWSRGPVKVSIEPRVDAEELGAVLEYSVDGGNSWTEYTEAITIENEGAKIQARLYSEEDDEYGDIVEETVTDKIDKVNPKQFTPTGTSTDSSITLTGNTEDGDAEAGSGSSGINVYYYSIDNGTTWLPRNGTKETSYTFTGLPDTTTYSTLKMKAVDYAGNSVETETITVATKKVNKPYVGDYVNYTPQSEVTSYNMAAIYSGYTSDQTISQDTTLKWRILNINDDGTIDLISEKSTKQIVNLKGGLGYNNGVYLLNDLCQTLYSNSEYGATARSIKIEDVQDKMDLSVWDYHNYSGYGKTITKSGKYRYPYLWTLEKTEVNAIDEVLIGGDLEQSEQNELTTEDFYYSNKSIIVTQNYWSKSLSRSNFKTVKTRQNEIDDSIYYDLLLNNAGNFTYASRGVRDGESWYLFFNGGGAPMLAGTSQDSGPGSPARPIVTLPRCNLDLSTVYEDIGIWNLK